MRVSTMRGRVLVDAIAPVFGLVMALWVIWNIDTRFFPVASEFTIQSSSQSKDAYTTLGTVVKNRNCEPLGVSIYLEPQGLPKSVIAQYQNDIFVGTAGTGFQTWGPVALPLGADLDPQDIVEIDGLFRCHSLWLAHVQYLRAPWSTLQKYATAPTPQPTSPDRPGLIRQIPGQ